MKNLLSSLSLVGSYAAVTALTVGSIAGLSHTAHAADGKACYEQFSVAKKAGNLTVKNFKEYKAAYCEGKKVTTIEKPIAPELKKNEKQPGEAAKDPAKKENIEKTPVITGDIAFPDKIDPLFANEKEGTARMHTCQKQYHLNQAAGKNGGLKWIQKGGGYYSECNKHLKAAIAK